MAQDKEILEFTKEEYKYLEEMIDYIDDSSYAHRVAQIIKDKMEEINEKR
jgi:hypothetical protein